MGPGERTMSPGSWISVVRWCIAQIFTVSPWVALVCLALCHYCVDSRGISCNRSVSVEKVIHVVARNRTSDHGLRLLLEKVVHESKALRQNFRDLRIDFLVHTIRLPNFSSTEHESGYFERWDRKEGPFRE